ncbi:MAG: hypothetical protein SH850_21250 [Planctomycetaceae bacterium]|nr:hypothetical protein [Planctomycetaceae bacterium]
MQTRVSEKITLAEVGIDKGLADRARKYAAVPDDEWEIDASADRRNDLIQGRGAFECTSLVLPSFQRDGLRLGDGHWLDPFALWGRLR